MTRFQISAFELTFFSIFRAAAAVTTVLGFALPSLEAKASPRPNLRGAAAGRLPEQSPMRRTPSRRSSTGSRAPRGAVTAGAPWACPEPGPCALPPRGYDLHNKSTAGPYGTWLIAKTGEQEAKAQCSTLGF